MNPALTNQARLNPIQRASLGIGVIALIICAVAAFFDSGSFFHSYLVAYVFWVSLALGSLGIVMLHNLVGGRWGAIIRRFLESGVRTLPLMAVMVIPILLGVPVLYEWSHHEVVAHDAVLRHKEGYLNPTSFIVRTVFYFAIWISLFRCRWRVIVNRARLSSPEGHQRSGNHRILIFRNVRGGRLDHVIRAALVLDDLWRDLPGRTGSADACILHGAAGFCFRSRAVRGASRSLVVSRPREPASRLYLFVGIYFVFSVPDHLVRKHT